MTTVIGYDKANGETSTVSSSTQAHSIPLAILEEEEDGMPPAKRAKIPAPERQKRERATAAKLGFGVSLSMRAFQTARHERDVLRDGLSFPTLTIPEAVGKEKEVALELVLGEPGVDPATVYDSRPRSDNAKAVEGDASTSAIDHAVLQDFFAQNGQIDQSREPADEGELPSSSTSTPAPWVTFRSAPLRVVSKPSQKTVKARSMLSCLSTNDTVSLFTRIHGQTVRTKYMKLETEPSARLSAKSGRWTPFRFEIIEPGAPLPKPARTRPSKDKILDEQYRDNVLTYGSIVRLEDVQSGYKSEPVKLVRVERNEAIVDGDIGQPVSELHRVGFVKVDDAIGGLARQYLSAPGARVGGAELELGESRGSRRRPRPKAAHASPAAAAEAKEEESAPHTSLAEAEQSATTSSSAAEPAPLGAESYPPGKRTSRRALARATIAEAEEGSTQAQLAWATANAETREVAIEEDGKTAKRMAQVEKVPDWMCWVITGVGKCCPSDGLSSPLTPDSVFFVFLLSQDSIRGGRSGSFSLPAAGAHTSDAGGPYRPRRGARPWPRVCFDLPEPLPRASAFRPDIRLLPWASGTVGRRFSAFCIVGCCAAPSRRGARDGPIRRGHGGAILPLPLGGARIPLPYRDLERGVATVRDDPGRDQGDCPASLCRGNAGRSGAAGGHPAQRCQRCRVVARGRG